MALSDRPDIDENSIPKPPTGYQADVRYQKVIDLTADMSHQMLTALISELQSLNTANAGSRSHIIVSMKPRSHCDRGLLCD